MFVCERSWPDHLRRSRGWPKIICPRDTFFALASEMAYLSHFVSDPELSSDALIAGMHHMYIAVN